MKVRYSQETPRLESRFFFSSVVIVFVFCILCVRLWHLQIYRGDFYRNISENNRIRRIEIPAQRGLIFDRNGQIVLGNRPFFDLVFVPQYLKNRETTLKILSNLLQVPQNTFESMLKANAGRPKFLPITLKRNLSLHEVSIIESNKVFLPGIEVNIAPRRDYSDETPAHIVGYMSEISGKELKDRNEDSPGNPYLPGDLVGKQGLEAKWEHILRGERGYRYIQVDAFGRQSAATEQNTWELPVKSAVPGSDLTLTIDRDLQRAANAAFKGKYGAVVVLNPQNGEILAMISAPSYNPAIYQDGLTPDKWQALLADPYKPLFDKTTGGTFPPGSVYKPIVALAALSEGIVNPQSAYQCGGSFSLGKDVFHCYQRSGHGRVNLRTALMRSCDVYFYNLGIELGVDRLAKYAKAFGLGSKLGLNLNKEDPGLIPTTAAKKLIPNMSWTIGDTPLLAIGQSANLLTPIQIASVYASFANGGKIWRPYIVSKVTNFMGETVLEKKPELISQVDIIKPEHFALLRDILHTVVKEGTGRNAQVEGVTVAGKTGSVQVVSLKKNRNQNSEVSMRWREHAMFAAFSPVENAEIAIAVVSENDYVGGGSTAAAPVAHKIINSYWQLKKARAENISQKSGAKSVQQTVF